MLQEYIPLPDLWTFIYGKLNGVVSCSVYDFVPEEASYPYVVFGEEIVVPQRDKQNIRFLVDTFFHVYSDAKGRKEVTDIANEILQILTNRTNIFNKSFPGDEHGVIVSGLSDNGFSSVVEEDSRTNEIYRHGILSLQWLIY